MLAAERRLRGGGEEDLEEDDDDLAELTRLAEQDSGASVASGATGDSVDSSDQSVASDEDAPAEPPATVPTVKDMWRTPTPSQQQAHTLDGMLDSIRQQENTYDEVVEPEQLAMAKQASPASADSTAPAEAGKSSLCVANANTAMNGTYHQWQAGQGGTYVYKKGEPPHHQLLYRGKEERWMLQQGYDDVQYISDLQSTLIPGSGLWRTAHGGGQATLHIIRGSCAPLGGGGRTTLWRDCGGCGVHLCAEPDGEVRLSPAQHAVSLGPTFRQLQRYLQAHGRTLLRSAALPVTPYLHPRTQTLLRRAIGNGAVLHDDKPGGKNLRY